MVKIVKKAETKDDGMLLLKRGCFIADRYQVLRSVGFGVYANVAAVRDHQDSKKTKALKAIRAEETFTESGVKEVKVLRMLAYSDNPSKNYFSVLLDAFDYNGHVCMVQPLYGRNLYTFLENNNFRGLPLQHCQTMCYELLSAVAYMHKLGLIHTDIKPENVMLKTDASICHEDVAGKYEVLVDPSIVLGDFNSVFFSNDAENGDFLIQTPNYRAPEVILGLDWNSAVDVWSIGCVIVDIFVGSSLFISPPAKLSEAEQSVLLLNNIITYCGPVPSHMLQRAFYTVFKNFSHTVCMTNDEGSVGNPCLNYPKFKPLKQLIRELLVIDPICRATCEDALQSKFFNEITKTINSNQKRHDS